MSAHVLLNIVNELGKKDKNVRLAKHFIAFSKQTIINSIIQSMNIIDFIYQLTFRLL